MPDNNLSESISNQKEINYDNFKLLYKPFDHLNYNDFVTEKNIFNNDILNEENLNRAVNVIKKESTNTWAILQILQSRLINKWHPKETYEVGEFVYWPSPRLELKKEEEFREKLGDNFDRIYPMMNDNQKYDEFEINNMYFVACHDKTVRSEKDGLIKKNINKAKDPYQYVGVYWLPVNKGLLLPDYDLTNCAKYLDEDNQRSYTLNEDGTKKSPFRMTKKDDLVNLEYVKTEDDKIKKTINDEYLKKVNTDRIPCFDIDEYNSFTEEQTKEIYNAFIQNNPLFESSNNISDATSIQTKASKMVDAMQNPNNVITKESLDMKIKRLTKLAPTNSLTLTVSNTNHFRGLKPEDFVRCNSDRQLTYKNDSQTHMVTPLYGFIPPKDNITNLGEAKNKFKTVYATDFIGVALRARYADLAEKYKTDKEYEPGTILGLQNGIGTIYKKGMKLLGVVAKNPALKLNDEIKGQYITLKGLTPVKINKNISAKLDSYVIADDNGEAILKDDYDFDDSKKLIGVVIEIINKNTVLVKI